MATYTFSDISNVSDLDTVARDRCLDASWTSLLEAYPWDVVSDSGYDINNDGLKKGIIRDKVDEYITSSNYYMCQVYDDTSWIRFFIAGEIDRDNDRITIAFLMYGPDENGSRRYIATDVLEMKKGFRRFCRENGIRNVEIFYTDTDTAMKRTINNRYEGHSVDLGERDENKGTVDFGEGTSITTNAKINKYRLSSDPTADELD